MAVTHFLDQLRSDSTLQCHVIECNLCKIFLALCDDLDIADAIPEMEDSEGSIFLLEQLHSAIGESEFIEKIRYAPHRRGDVLLLTGAGDMFPFIILPLISEYRELAVKNALLESFDRAPFNVLRNAASSFPCERREDRKHQFSVTTQGIDVFLLETHFNAEILRVSDRVQKIHGVSRKSLDRFGEDNVDVSGFRLCQHAIELLTLFGGGARNFVVRKNSSVFPFRILLNQ